MPTFPTFHAHKLLLQSTTPARLVGGVFLLALIAGRTVSAQEPASGASPTLEQAVKSYLSSAGEDERAALAARIEELAEGNPERVAAALKQAVVWEEPRSKAGAMVVGAAGERLAASYHLPASYEPERAWPVILRLGSASAAREGLESGGPGLPPGELGGRFVLIEFSPTKSTFDESAELVEQIEAVIVEARRRFHLDGDRVFLWAEGRSAAAGWLAGLFRPDLFAGVVIHSCEGPPLPYPGQSMPLLAANLKMTALLLILPGCEGRSDGRQASGSAGRALASLASVEGAAAEVCVCDSPHEACPCASRGVEGLPGRTRTAPGSEAAARWFRYPEQGELGWTGEVKPLEEVWTEGELAIRPGPGADRDEFIRSVLKKHLMYIGGAAEGQAIELQTVGVGRLVIRLYEDSVDWSQPVVVEINGRKRHASVVKPSIQTMLESARASANLDRPAWATLSFSIRGGAGS